MGHDDNRDIDTHILITKNGGGTENGLEWNIRDTGHAYLTFRVGKTVTTCNAILMLASRVSIDFAG